MDWNTTQRVSLAQPRITAPPYLADKIELYVTTRQTKINKSFGNCNDMKLNEFVH